MKFKQDIIDILNQDARTPHETIAVMLGADKAAVSAAIAEMEQDGTIVKYTALVNTDKLDRSVVEEYIELRVSPSHTAGFDAIAEAVGRFDEVKSVFLMSGGYDLAVIVEGKNLRDVAMFVSEKLAGIDRIVTTATHFILKRYKSGGVFMTQSPDTERLAVHA